MSDRSTGLMIAVVAVFSLAPVPGAGQTLPPSRDAVAPTAPKAAAGAWIPPRTPDGQPDIQGTWNQRDNITTYSLQAGAEDRAVHIGITGQAPATGQPIKDPPNKIPYLPWAEEKARFLYEEHRRPTSPEYLDPVTRGFLEGVPRINLQGGFQILQPPGQVVLVHEFSHTYRVIPLDGRPHLNPRMKLWMGDSRGHWEGNTLVVDVTNHNDQTWFDIVGSFHSDALHVVERWTMANADRIDYEVTIEDAKVFTRPWKMALTINRNKQPGYEIWEDSRLEGERDVDHILLTGKRDKEAGRTGIHEHRRPR